MIKKKIKQTTHGYESTRFPPCSGYSPYWAISFPPDEGAASTLSSPMEVVTPSASPGLAIQKLQPAVRNAERRSAAPASKTGARNSRRAEGEGRRGGEERRRERRRSRRSGLRHGSQRGCGATDGCRRRPAAQVGLNLWT